MPLPKRYVPDTLSKRDKQLQIESIRKGTPRPVLPSYRLRKSQWTQIAETCLGEGRRLTQIARKLGVPYRALKEIYKRGEKAYYTSGSRPNVTPQQWAQARVYAVLFGSKGARRADGDIVRQYKLGVYCKADQSTRKARVG